LARLQIIVVAVFVAAVSAAGASARSDPARPTQLRFDSRVYAGSAGTPVTSSNWAGYALTGASTPGTAPTEFTNVYGTWVQPAATCTAGQPSYSAFWVGLGGFDSTSQALEQIGTAADCDPVQGPMYFAWYELLPATSVRLKLVVRPGDAMSAAVTVNGQIVSLRIRDLTRHTVVNRKLRMTSPDLSSAELIAEAPATCNKAGRCHALPLANFGTMTFTSRAATAAARPATFGDPAWSATEIDLQPNVGGAGQPSSGAAAASAVPTGLGADGSFSVTWQQVPAQPPPP
jgi:Peptidase A4 family